MRTSEASATSPTRSSGRETVETSGRRAACSRRIRAAAWSRMPYRRYIAVTAGINVRRSRLGSRALRTTADAGRPVPALGQLQRPQEAGMSSSVPRCPRRSALPKIAPASAITSSRSSCSWNAAPELPAELTERADLGRCVPPPITAPISAAIEKSRPVFFSII